MMGSRDDLGTPLRARPAVGRPRHPPPGRPVHATSTAGGCARTRSRTTARRTARSGRCATAPRQTCARSSRRRRPRQAPTPAAIADLYASFMDVERVEALGVDAAAPAARRDRRPPTDRAALAARAGPPPARGPRGAVRRVRRPPTRRTPPATSCTSSQSGLGLPDESYYREDAYAEIRTAYVAHLARLAELVGLRRSGAGSPSSVMDLETALAAVSWDRVTNRDAEKTYTLMTLPALRAARARRSTGTPWLDRARRAGRRLRRDHRAPAELRRRGRAAVGRAPARAVAGVARDPHRVARAPTT